MEKTKKEKVELYFGTSGEDKGALFIKKEDGILLRIDSFCGGGYASQIICRSVEELKEAEKLYKKQSEELNKDMKQKELEEIKNRPWYKKIFVKKVNN